MRIVKWVLGIAGFILIAIMITGYFLLSGYDFNRVKPAITKKVMESTGRKLRMDGDIRLEIGLTPILVIEDIGLQNAPWGSRDEMVRINRFEVQLELFPLLKKEIKINKFILVEPDILIETNSLGKSNIEMGLAEIEKPVEPGKKAGEDEISLPPLAFNNFKIDRGVLQYRDGNSGNKFILRLERLEAVTKDLESPVNLEVIGFYNDEKIDLKGDLGPMTAFIDADKPWTLDLAARMGTTTVSVNGEIMDCLKAGDLDLVVSIEGQSISDLVRLAGKKAIPDIGPFKVLINLSDPGGNLSVEKLDIEAGTEELFLARLSGSVKDIKGKGDMDINFEFKGRELSNVEKIINQDIPIEGNLILSGLIQGELRGPYHFTDLDVSIGQNRVKGSINLDLSRKIPSINADLSSEKLDLRPFIEDKMEVKEKPEKAEKKGKEKVFPDDPLLLEGLHLANANIGFKARKLLFPKMVLDDLEIYLILNDGYFSIKKILALMGGGRLNGNLELHQEGEAAVLKTSLNVDKMDIGLMLRDLEVGDIAEGMLDLDIYFDTIGSTVADLMGKLNGRVVGISGNGRINNEYIELIGSDISSMLFRLLDPAKEKKGYTELNCFVTSFDIKDGIAKSRALVLDTSLMSIIGEGIVNLKTEELDFSVKPSPKQGLGGGILGKLSINFGELAKPLKLSGTLATPKLALDAAQTSIVLGKAVGGVLLFGPVGIAAALAGGASDDENPCVSAIEASEKGVQTEDKKIERKDMEQSTSSEEPVKAIKKKIEGLGGALKGLFK